MTTKLFLPKIYFGPQPIFHLYHTKLLSQNLLETIIFSDIQNAFFLPATKLPLLISSSKDLVQRSFAGISLRSVTFHSSPSEVKEEWDFWTANSLAYEAFTKEVQFFRIFNIAWIFCWGYRYQSFLLNSSPLSVVRIYKVRR